METRRYLLAIALSMIVLVVYINYFAPKPVPPPTEEQAAPATAPAAPAVAPAAAPALRPEAIAPAITLADRGRDIVIETDVVKAVVNTAGGVITKWELKDYREADKTEVGIMPLYRKLTGGGPVTSEVKKELGNVQLFTRYDEVKPTDIVAPLTLTPTDAALARLSGVAFRSSADALRLSGAETKTLVLTYAGPGGLFIEKKLTFRGDAYDVGVEVSTRGLDGYALALGTDFGMYDKVSSNASGRVHVETMVDGKTDREKFDSIKGELQYSGTIDWFAQADKYFAAVLLSGKSGIVAARSTQAPKQIGNLVNTELLVKDKPASQTFTLYAGPKRYYVLEAFGKGLEKLVDFGWFGVLARPMFWLMKTFFSWTHSYGIAIILLTIVVRILLFYPSLKSATAMEEMKALQPELTALREKYKKDPQKMNQEMMRLYKEHKVNPAGGCLPMLLQLPFFVALYNVLNASIELRQAPFLSPWIKDLSVHDPFYILPVLMGASMVLTMKMTSTTVDPQQQKIMMYMNIAFIFLFAWLPAGLLLYITLSNLLSIAQQLYVRKLIAKS
jgi:YidC/Oxa1 family membrane protein insertase